MSEDLHNLLKGSRPGDHIIREIIKQRITISDFIKKSGIEESELLEIFAGNQGISEEIAERIGHALNIDPSVWIEVQEFNDAEEAIFQAEYKEFASEELISTPPSPIENIEPIIHEVINPIIERLKTKVNEELKNDLRQTINISEAHIRIAWLNYYRAEAGRQPGESKDETGVPDIIEELIIDALVFVFFRHVETSQLFNQ